jgi:hypothetical protein
MAEVKALQPSRATPLSATLSAACKPIILHRAPIQANALEENIILDQVLNFIFSLGALK